jgi:hypothetical protein
VVVDYKYSSERQVLFIPSSEKLCEPKCRRLNYFLFGVYKKKQPQMFIVYKPSELLLRHEFSYSITKLDACWRTEIGWTKTRKFFIFTGIKEPLPLKTRRSPNATLHESQRLYILRPLKIVRRTHIYPYYKASYLTNVLLGDSWTLHVRWTYLMPGISRNIYFRRILIHIYFVYR